MTNGQSGQESGGTSETQVATSPVQSSTIAETKIELDITKSQESVNPFKIDEHLPSRFKTDEYKPWLDSTIRNSNNPNQLEVLLEQSWNAQKRIGEKGLKVPGEGATPEELADFRKAIGVPEKPEEYKFTDTPWSEEEKELGEILSKSRSPEYMAKVNKIFHEAGIPPKQAEQLVHAYDKLILAEHNETITKLAADEAAMTEDFESRANRWYGTRKDSVMSEGKKLVDAAMADPKTPDEAKALVHTLGNDIVLALAPILDHINRTYIQEDTGGMQNTLGTNAKGAYSRDQLRDEIRQLQGNPDYYNGGPKHAEIQARINDLSKQVVALDKSAAAKR